MQIKDVMTKEVISVPEDMPITEVANLLMKHKIHGVPVVDDKNRVVGIVTETDFFMKDAVALYLPAYIDILKAPSGQNKRVVDDIPAAERLVRARASDIMTPRCVTLPPEADVEDLLAAVRLNHYKTFPVTDSQYTLLGVVTLIDVISLLDRNR
jgi:CBS domain-containing protein